MAKLGPPRAAGPAVPNGLIIPRIRAGDHGAADKFAPEDLDAFLARMLDSADPVDGATAGQVNIPDAAKLAFAMSEDLARLMLDGNLPENGA
ncbi:hypothetical protein V1281_006695 [Nitrobacteraceae bacterium AZCC 2161]